MSNPKSGLTKPEIRALWQDGDNATVSRRLQARGFDLSPQNLHWWLCRNKRPHKLESVIVAEFAGLFAEREAARQEAFAASQKARRAVMRSARMLATK